MGVVKGRYGFKDRVTALKMTEKVLEAGRRLRITFDSVDGTAKKSLNETQLTADDRRDRVAADNQGEWELTQYRGRADGAPDRPRVLVRYKSSLDINTSMPDPIVGTAVPDDTREVFDDILKEIARRCRPSR